MNWYYADAGKPAGPVPAEQLDELVRSGRVPPETLVWCEGMANWQPYNQARRAFAAAAAPGAPPAESVKVAAEPAVWYYDDGGKPSGPISESELESLAAAGKLRPDTRVWRDGMANWQPYSVARAAGRVGAGATAEVAGGVVCVECKGVFPQEGAIKYGSVWVCAACKPTFVEKLRGGAPDSGGGEVLRYAGFWIRLGAVFVDGIILWVTGVLIGIVAGLEFMTALGVNPSPEMTPVQIVVLMLQTLTGVAYETFFLGRFGATPGKMACGLRVVTGDGGRVSYARACGRYFGKILSYLTCSIGFIIAAFDREKRALHDHICNTRVIYK